MQKTKPSHPDVTARSSTQWKPTPRRGHLNLP